MFGRRDFLKISAATAGAAALGGCLTFGGRARRFALNPPTVKGYGLSLGEQVRLAIEAGFDGIEPWLADVHKARLGGRLADAVKIARDGGLEFVNGIAFGRWAHPDAGIRMIGLEETKRDMAVLAEMGCPCIAASMFGVHKPGSPHLSAQEIADRFGAVCELGRKMGVRPLLEYWGHSVNMSRLEDALDVLEKVGQGDAAVLADVYHTYRGGGSFETFRRLKPGQLPILHMNDYPADPPRGELVDADRIWPGDGIAPWQQIFACLDEANVNPWLSIELFNPNYWNTMPLDTMRMALAKMKNVAEGRI